MVDVADETATTLTALTRLSAQVAELELRVAEHAKEAGVGESSGATSTANYWAHATHQTRTEAHRKMKLAEALATRPTLRAALAAGDVLVDQARVVAAAVDAVPAEFADRAEQLLIGFAADHDAKALKILGMRILEYLDPEAAEAHEAAQLEKEERRRRRVHPADHVRRRARQGARPVHPPGRPGRDAEEGAARVRRPQAPRRRRRPPAPASTGRVRSGWGRRSPS